MGETRSPENQQSRGSCPGAPASGNPEGQGSRDWQGEQSQRKCALAPFIGPWEACPHLALGGWAPVLNSLTQSKVLEPGRALQGVPSACLPGHAGSCRGALSWEAGPGSSYCSVSISLEHVTHSLVPVCHLSSGRAPYLSFALLCPLVFSTDLACGRCPRMKVR